MKNIKIVFTDLDGTLAKAPGIIDIKNKIIFEKLKSIGIPVVICTGRGLPYVMPLCKQFETSNYVISSNGAEIYNIAAKKVIYKSILSRDSIKKLDELIEKYKLFFVANTIEKRYTNQENDIGKIKRDKLAEIETDITQVVLQSYDLDTMKYLRRDIETETNLIIANKSKKIVENKLLYYDVVNKDVSKGNALKILCDYLNIDNKKAMAIGDFDNDISMFEVAGLKVAVENASENLKKQADIITLSNTNNGVETVLNMLYKEIK